VIAVIGGLGAALAWATSTLCSSRSSRLVEPASVVAWVMIVGLIITLPVAAIEGVPARLDGSAGAWLVASGVGNVAGLAMTYRALRVAHVSLIAPLVSTEGAVAAVIALAAGETLPPLTAAMLVVIAVGIFMAAASRSPPAQTHLAGTSRALLLAGLAALSFGFGLYSTARAGSELPSAWVVLSPRVIGVLGLALPLAVRGRLHLTRRAFGLVVVSGIAEVLGFYSYTGGSRHGIAVAAVLSSQFAALAALGGYLLFKERLERLQLAGVLTVLIGVAVLSASQA
jgi:drug/metabolite transporter (DMT)-like permease